ncbi:MAG: AEC family transporter [Campylobacterota bacterium]|nr:AEC family transporter [Campylobacterota bacterium]
MQIYIHTLTSILVLVLLILFVAYLRHRGHLKQESGALFSWLVMQVTLPALLFTALAHSAMEWHYLLLFLIMFGAEMILLLTSWGVGRFLKLKSEQMGTFLIVSTFGSSALLGYALIAELFPGNSAVLVEAAFVSELGVGLPIFTIGVMIAIYYGSTDREEITLLEGILPFFRSPIFLSIVLGILWSTLSLPTQGIVIEPLFDMIHIIAKSNTFIVALTVGVMLNFSSLRDIIYIIVATIILKLILSPILVWIPAGFMDLEIWQLQVLILESAMPSAMLSVVLANRYGCDAKLAAKLVFVTLFASILTAPMMLKLLA